MMSCDPRGLRAEALACRRGGRTVFTGLSFSVAPGEALVVAGPNGAGKSSLLKVLAGVLPAAAGNVHRPGAMAYLGHDNALKPILTVADNLQFWAALAGAGAAEADARALAAAEMTGVDPLWDVPVRLLSAGQKRRVALARVLASSAPVWLLDEPTVGLDAASVERLGPALARHQAEGGIIVATSHTPLPLAEPRVLPMGGRA